MGIEPTCRLVTDTLVLKAKNEGESEIEGFVLGAASALWPKNEGIVVVPVCSLR